jgi:hypothetical protein
MIEWRPTEDSITDVERRKASIPLLKDRSRLRMVPTRVISPRGINVQEKPDTQVVTEDKSESLSKS